MSHRWILVLVAAGFAAGCSKPRTDVTQSDNSAITALTRCTGCHGDPQNGNAAPPLSVHGENQTTAIAVGAHQAHLQINGLRQPVDCSECHVVPSNVYDPGHIDSSTATLTWGPIASAGGVTPTYTRSADGTSATCTNYCHGAAFTANNGALHAPIWTKVDGSQGGCGTCHGLPPPPPHPPAANITACSNCHPRTVNPDGTINVGGGRHINGIVEIGTTGAGCTSCHGDGSRTPADIAAAPPRDAQGKTDPTSPGVGAHLAHLVGGPTRGPLPCEACHRVPTDLSHINGVVDFTWGPLSQTGGITPTFSTSTLTCANYCHGTADMGGSNHAPKWTGGAAEAACGTCHGIPPPAPHVPVAGGPTQCNVCHAGTVKADGTIDTAGGKHINGTVDVSVGGCTACHGDSTRDPSIAAAPPRAISGATATTDPGVGAHQAHLTAATLVSTPIGCGECHIVPTTYAHAAGPLNLTWGPLASANGVSPTFNQTAVTCTNYCHGQTAWGGSNSTPVWTAGSSQVTCGTCHGLPPPTGQHGVTAHTALACATCHGTGYATGVAKPLHINGTKDILLVTGTTAGITAWTPPTGTTPGTCAASCHNNTPRNW